MRPKTYRISPLQSDVLDCARWIAAFLVVIEHLRSLMFTSFGPGDHLGVMGKTFYFLTGFGHSSVMVFFVMSGFLVGSKILERMAAGTFSWQKYVIDRTSRLYAVYLLALLLGGLLDYFGFSFFNQYGLYDQTFPGRINVVNFNFRDNLSESILGLNLLMCQTILGPVFGSNGPLWSLANEFWYYLLAPISFSLFYIYSKPSKILALAALALMGWFLPAPILIYFLVWLMGASLYFFNSKRVLPLWCSLILFGCCFSLARLRWMDSSMAPDFLIGVSFALVINSAAGSMRRLPRHQFSKWAADFSYSVYLCHFPLVVFLLSAIYRYSGTGIQAERNVPTGILFLLILSFVYAASFAVSLITERQTPRIRDFLYRLFGRTQLIAGIKVTRLPDAP